MPQIRKETYNQTGLVKTEFIEVEGLTQEELIAQILEMFEELKRLKGNNEQ